jgi:homoserine O-acetyltransferase/O-succinyltransferase
MKRILLASFLALTSSAFAVIPEGHPGDYIVRDFQFKDGQRLPEVRMHYLALGSPARDQNGRVTNAVLILHGTGGSSKQFMEERFAGVLFNPGQLLDITKYYVIIPDNVGHGGSTRPSDGLKMHFPHADYDDMVALQHALLLGLGVNHLRLIFGTSMGCMHSWVWGETYPEMMDALMPMACAPTEIAGRNRMWRKAAMDAIRRDPAWENGDYKAQPASLITAENFLQLMGSNALERQKQGPTRDQADLEMETQLNKVLPTLDANDFLYFLDASRNYNPEPNLEKITAPVMFVNSADDFINPPELGVAPRLLQRVKRGKFVLLPYTADTHGHGSHTWAALWQQYLEELLQESGGLAPGTRKAITNAAGLLDTGPVMPPPPLPPNWVARGDPMPQTGPVAITLPDGTVAYRVGNGVLAPRAIYTPDPDYPESARKMGRQGLVVLHCIVGADGLIRDVNVARALGHGLDEKAIEAVRKWRFQPATKDGQPVAAMIDVEVTFRMYPGH